MSETVTFDTIENKMGMTYGEYQIMHDKMMALGTEADWCEDPFRTKLSKDDLNYIEEHWQEYSILAAESRMRYLQSTESEIEILDTEKSKNQIILTCRHFDDAIVTDFFHTGDRAYFKEFFKVRQNANHTTQIRVISYESDDFSKLKHVWFV